MNVSKFIDTAPARELRAAWAAGKTGPLFEYKTDLDKEYVKELAARAGGVVDTTKAGWRMAHVLPSKALFCKECGHELDQDDVDANLAAWGVFKMCCLYCIEESD